MGKPLKIGTRGSPLALAQTELFIAALKKARPELRHSSAIEIVTITTSGDRIQDRPLSEAGGKGLFTKEIEDALLEGAIDCAVHSMKDMPTQLPPGLVIPCLLPREDPRDAFISLKAKSLAELPRGAVVGTSSLRRQAILLARRPDLQVVTFRGNVGTRLKKLQEGVVDATLLALAGLKRLGKETLATSILEHDEMLPAVAQGAVGIEVREGDRTTRDVIAPVHCAITELRVTAERAFLACMDGSCRTPLAALMSEPDPHHRARFEALAATPDGRDVAQASYMMSVAMLQDAVRLGETAARDIRKQMAERAAR